MDNGFLATECALWLFGAAAVDNAFVCREQTQTNKPQTNRKQTLLYMGGKL